MQSSDNTWQPNENDQTGLSTIPLAVRSSAWWVVCLVTIGVGIVAVGYVINFFGAVVYPFAVAVLLTAMLQPIVDRIHSWGAPRSIGVGVAIALALAVISGLIALVGTGLAAGMEDLMRSALDGVNELRDWLNNGPFRLSNDDFDAYIQQVSDQARQNSTKVATSVAAVTAGTAEVLTGLVLALFCTVFLLFNGVGVWSWLLSLTPRAAHSRLHRAAIKGWATLSSFVRATVVVALADAVGIGAGAALLGVPLALPIGVLVFLGAFVPVIGALLSGVVAVLVAFVAKGPAVAALMLLVVFAVQQLESHILQPFLLGRAVSVHPLGVVLAIGAGLILAGILGALLAVPIVAVANTMIRDLVRDDTQFDDVGSLVSQDLGEVDPTINTDLSTADDNQTSDEAESTDGPTTQVTRSDT